MAVGFPTKANWAAGDILTAAQMDDLAGTLNTVQAPLGNAAGKNVILNSAFDYWQRGTSISVPTNTITFGPDRFRTYCTFSAGTASFSQQTFTPGTAPVAGYEGTYFARLTCGSTSTYAELSQKIEDVRTYAGQTVTYSFWAKSSAAITFTPYLIQNFGSGGSADVNTTASNITLTTSWVRYSGTVAIPAITGKTVGTSSALILAFIYSSGTLNSATIDTWGWQLEAGSTATNFQTATGTKAGELASCERCYWRWLIASTNAITGIAGSTSIVDFFIRTPTTMRTNGSAIDVSALQVYSLTGGTNYSSGTFTLLQSTPDSFVLRYTHGSAVFTLGSAGYILNGSSGSAYLGITAEL